MVSFHCTKPLTMYPILPVRVIINDNVESRIFSWSLQTREESSCLGVQALLYYGGVGEKKSSLLHRFTFHTEEFDVFDLIAELDVSSNVPLSPLFGGWQYERGRCVHPLRSRTPFISATPTHSTLYWIPQDTQEAKCLADQVEMYYCDATPEKLALLESFTENPSEFKHMDLVAQMESISLVQSAQVNVEETNKQKWIFIESQEHRQ